jgi:hypothetical protein
VDDSSAVHVVYGRKYLTHIAAGLTLRQSPLGADVLHEAAATTELHNEVVGVVRLYDLVQLYDVGMSQLLHDARLATEIPLDIGILARLFLVDDLDGHLQTCMYTSVDMHQQAPICISCIHSLYHVYHDGQHCTRTHSWKDYTVFSDDLHTETVLLFCVLRFI